MKADIPIDYSKMEEESYLQPDDIDEGMFYNVRVSLASCLIKLLDIVTLEIEIIDERELLEINEQEEAEANRMGEGDDDNDDDEGDENANADVEDDNYTTDNEPPEDNARRVLTGHEEAVLSICVTSKGDIVVSGGQDDKALIWDTNTGEIIFKCTGYKDSVVSTKLSAKETYVATGDMSGLIIVWKLDTKEKVFEYEVEDLQWLDWHPILDHVLIAGTESAAWMFNVTDPSQVKTFPGFGISCTAGKVFPSGTKSIMGYEDGSIRFWDLKTVSATSTLKGTTK